MTAHAQTCEFCVSRVDGQTFLIAMTSSANVVEKEDMVKHSKTVTHERLTHGQHPNPATASAGRRLLVAATRVR
jgi:hypothetical protein